jgi:hypothetical protein
VRFFQAWALSSVLSVVGCGSSADSSTPADSGPSGDGTTLPETGASDGDGARETGLDSGSVPDGGPLPGDAAGAGDGALLEPVPSCSKPGAPVMAARDFLDSWGVNASPSAATAASIAAHLNKIGFRRIRTQLWLQSLSDWQALQAAMKSGGYARPALRFDTLVDAYNNNSVTWNDQKAGLIAAGASGLLGSIEGPNEMNNPSVGGGSHGVNDPADQTAHWAGPTGNLSAWMKAIRTWRDGLTGSDANALEGVELIAPTIASGLQTDYQMMPELSAFADEGTLHYYSGNGHQPSLEQGAYNAGVGYFANLYAWCKTAVSPTKPLVVSECGATTAPGGTYSLHAQAAYFLNQMHEAAGIGARRFYFYTLVDPQSGAAGGSEGNFGMFKTDGSDKDITVALASLKDLFSLNDSYDDPANALDTGPFAKGYDGCGLQVTGIGSAGFSSRVSDAVVFMKSDGSTVISVTNEPRLSDASGNDVTPTPVAVTVDFGSSHAWKVYDPLGASPLTPTATGSGTRVNLTLVGYPQYVVVAP